MTYELLNKFKESLFAIELVNDEEAVILYDTILFWREYYESNLRGKRAMIAMDCYGDISEELINRVLDDFKDRI